MEPSRKLRSEKQNKHCAAKCKAMRTSQRKSKVLKRIAPVLDEGSLCEKKSHRKRAFVETEQKRKEMDEIILLLCQDDSGASALARQRSSVAKEIW